MGSIADSIAAFFQGASTVDLTRFIGALALIGTATMAVLQVIKDVLPVRAKYQRHRVRRWLREGIDTARTKHAALIKPNDPAFALDVDKAESDLGCLAVDNDLAALYDLPVEQLAGQMTAAFQMVLDYPLRYARLLLIVGSEASTEDLAAILNQDLPPTALADGVSDAALADLRQRYVDARNRVSHQFQRAVDGFQIAVAFRWKWSLQVASFLLSAGFAIWALNSTTTKVDQRVVFVLGTAVLAGFLAPVARDLTAALQQLRGKGS